MKVIHNEKLKNIPEYSNALIIRRNKLDFTQEKLAQKMGISAMYLSHLERGTRHPNLMLLEKWANCLGAEIRIEIINLLK